MFEVVAADKMFENWLLGDIQNISQNFPDKIKSTNNDILFESTHGKSKFRSVLKDDYAYKVIDKPSFYIKIRTNEAIKNSASFQSWIQALNNVNVPIIPRA